MADKISVTYFLEDRAQEGLIKALVERVASEESIPPPLLRHSVRSARHGSRVIIEFRNFLKDARRAGVGMEGLVIVSVDGNCKGYKDRIKQLSRYVRPTDRFRNMVIYAVPDPHIERWYLMDQGALKVAIGLNRAPELPTYKCKKAYYKQILNHVLREAGVQSLLGGPEYAEKIIESISDLRLFAQQNAGLERFVEDLRRLLRQLHNQN